MGQGDDVCRAVPQREARRPDRGVRAGHAAALLGPQRAAQVTRAKRKKKKKKKKKEEDRGGGEERKKTTKKIKTRTRRESRRKDLKRRKICDNKNKS